MEVEIEKEKIRSTSLVTLLLRVHVDDKQNFNLANCFIYSNFNYCPLVCMLSHKKSLDRIESLHKRTLSFLLNDYDVISYE